MARREPYNLKGKHGTPGRLDIGNEVYDGCGMTEQNEKLLYDRWIRVSTGNRIKER
jgi:hypothetical protein